MAQATADRYTEEGLIPPPDWHSDRCMCADCMLAATVLVGWSPMPAARDGATALELVAAALGGQQPGQ